MSKNIKRIIVFLLILAAVAMLSLGMVVKATTPTITETTDPNDGYDTIEDNTIIIGVTKFTPNTIVTGVKAAIAGSNDMLVYASKNGSTENYSYPKMYYYIFGEWYEYDEAGKLNYIEEGIKSLDIYFVNNVQKEGIQIPTAPEEKAEYTVFFLDGQAEVAQEKVLEGETIADLPTVQDTESSIFTGWKDLAGNEFTSSTPVTSDTVLFPVWEEKQKVELSLTANGTTTTKEYYVGQEITEVAKKDGYTFEGWFAEDGTEYKTPFNMPETNLALTAKWSKTVSNVDEFKSGIANATETTTITLGADITGINETLSVYKDVTLEGNGKTLSFNALNKDKNGVASALVINKDNVVVNDLTVEMTAQDGWQGNYAIQVYNAEGVVLNNITASNGDAGLIVNASKVELTGTTTLLNNEVGGIEVSKGTGTGLQNSTLTVTGTISMNNEERTVPVIWIEPGQGTVIGEGVANYYSTKETNTKNQTYYYSSEEFATTQKVETTEEVDSLLEAIESGTVNNVELSENVVIEKSEALTLDKSITINGNGATIKDSLNITGDNVTVKDVVLNNKVTISGDNAVLDEIEMTGFDTGYTNNEPSGVALIEVDTEGDFTLTNSKFSNVAGTAYNLINVKTPNVVVIENNTFGADTDDLEGIYNLIEFSQAENEAIKDGTSISNNIFNADISHNVISMFNIENNATITIEGNTFAYSGNALRLSNYFDTSATFNIYNNTILDGATDGYGGFICFQAVGDTAPAHADKYFAKYTINVKNLIGTDGNVINTIEGEGTGANRVGYYYADYTVGNIMPDTAKAVVNFLDE